MRGHFRSWATAIAVALVLTLSSSHVAYADDPPFQFAIPAKTSGDSLAPAQAESNPYGCYGQSHDPHYSNEYDQVHAKAWSVCGAQVQYIAVFSELYAVHWWGGRTLVDSDSIERSYAWTTDNLTLTGNCTGGPQTWRIESYHLFRGYDGVLYEAWTANQKEVAC